jgi:ABC-2 type transport system permease protein
VTTRTVTDDAAGRADVANGKLDALLIGDGTQVSVVVKKDVNDKLKNVLHVLAGQLAFGQQITSLGGTPAQVQAAVASAPVTVTSLQTPHTFDAQSLVLGIIAGILIYLSLMLNGQSVAQGVVEEKSSRVVELLLATVRPWQLMTGKVMGIGIVGLIQIAVIGAAGVIAGLATGALNISVSAATGTIIWLIVWYLLGFFAYALAFAAVGALVSRQEDVAGVVTPVLMFVIVGYVLGVSILPADPSSGLIEVLSMIPTFAPTLMPMRLAMGGVPAWEAVVAVGATLAVIPGLIWLSARIYRNAVVRSGARVKLSEAWRAA